MARCLWGSDFFALTATVFLFSSGAHADDMMVTKLTNAYTSMIYSVCLTPDFDFEMAKQIAYDSGWPRTPALLTIAHAPDWDVAEYEGWIATIPEFTPFPVFFFVAHGSDGGRKLDKCGFYLGNANPEEIAAAMTSEASATAVVRSDSLLSHSIDMRFSDLPGISVWLGWEGVQGSGNGLEVIAVIDRGAAP